ncbi:T9SS type A sorting domain-containing protein [bacterium]|nr:T9SS type A sorting domain-containing protein [bacterium]
MNGKLCSIPAALVVILILCGTALADWGGIVQYTDSQYDDRNVIAHFRDYEIWMFWDRDIDGERQIFYRTLDLDGVPTGDEVQLTQGPGSNYAPMISSKLTKEFVSITWEHQNIESKDIYFRYFNGDIWSAVLPVFSSSEDEYNPWIATAVIPFNQDSTLTLVTGQTDNELIFQRIGYGNGNINTFDQVRLPCSHPISHPGGYIGYSFLYDYEYVFLWQNNLEADTTLERAVWVPESGWIWDMILPTETLNVFNPAFPRFSGLSGGMYFNHTVNGTVRAGRLYLEDSGAINLYPDIYPEFTGNIIDPFFGQNSFVSDVSGDYEIYWDDEGVALSYNGYQDLNPCAFNRWWSSWYHSYWQNFIFWESDYSGNWDIYGRASEVYMPVEDSGDTSSPDIFQISVHPNPGNAQFAIDLELPCADFTEVGIYNTAGQLIETISEDWLQAGHHALNWHPVNRPSGIYLVKVKIDEVQQIQKLVYLK